MGAGRYWPIWVAAVPVALWALVRAFGLESGSLPATTMFFTPYAAIAGLFVAGVAVAWRNWAAAALATLATASLLVAVLPRAVGSETVSAQGKATFTVLAANVYLGRADPSALVGLVDRYRPDLLSVEELTPSFARGLRRAGIESRLPHAALMAEPRGHGAGYRDAGDATGKGLEPTWPGPDTSPTGLITIDHVLADRHLGVAEYGVDDLAGSDHRAIHARLVLP